MNKVLIPVLYFLMILYYLVVGSRLSFTEWPPYP